MLDKHLIAKTEPAALQENMVEREGVRITVLGDRLFRNKTLLIFKKNWKSVRFFYFLFFYFKYSIKNLK